MYGFSNNNDVDRQVPVDNDRTQNNPLELKGKIWLW